MSQEQTPAGFTPEMVKERIEDLSVDLSYAQKSKDSAYEQHIDKRIRRLYNLLERIQKNARR
jgi:hypothetical protein